MRRYWVHPMNLKRDRYGEYHVLCLELEYFPEKYFTYFRMSLQKFNYLLEMIKSEITAGPSNYRKPIEPKLKLVLTLRYLATGSSFTDLALRFRCGRSTVMAAIKKTLKSIIAKILPLALPKQTYDSWINVSTQFLNRWNFPNCLGAVDGKHCTIFAPRKSGSMFFSYKKSFSIVLMAVVDANYKFIMVDVGAYGANHDSTVFSNTDFGRSWLNSDTDLNIPGSSALPGQDVPIPYFLVADEAFGLKQNIMTPYPGQNLSEKKRLYNYRLSRARRIVENAFGIMAHTWRILLGRINALPATANDIILACCVLHNFLRMETPTPRENFSEPEERKIIDPGRCFKAFDIRERIADWCVTEGNVDFQYNLI